MRPVVKLQPPTFRPPTNLTFAGSNRQVMLDVMKTVSPSLDDCLVRWSTVVELELQQQAVPPRWQEAADAIEAAVADRGYQGAGPFLLATLGEYCSYCESWLSTQVAVEHVAPKSQFPMYSCSWDNFLIACTACNSNKNARPSRAQAYAWAQTPLLPSPGEVDCYSALRYNHYVWPDVQADSYQVLVPELFWRSPAGQFELLIGGMGTNPQSRLSPRRPPDPATGTVWADLSDGATVYPDIQVEVHMVPANARAIEAVALTDLNDRQRGISDRRVYNRTLAWFSVLKFVQMLRSGVQFEVVWPLLVDNSRTAGFFSVYVRILSGYVQWGINLGKYFAAMNPWYPNTDTTLVP